MSQPPCDLGTQHSTDRQADLHHARHLQVPGTWLYSADAPEREGVTWKGRWYPGVPVP